jgi:hypothetical protein
VTSNHCNPFFASKEVTPTSNHLSDHEEAKASVSYCIDVFFAEVFVRSYLSCHYV